MDNYQTDQHGTQHLTEASAPPTGNPAPLSPITVILGRDAILLQRGQTKRELVDVPAWGGAVYVKGMTGAERDSFEDSLMVTLKNGTREMSIRNFRAKLVARCVVNAEGQHLFRPADIEALGELDATGLEIVLDVARRLSGMTNKDVDELTGKSESEPSDANTFA